MMHTMNSMDVNNAMDDRKKRRRLIAGVLFTVYFAVLFYFLFFSEKMGRTYSERAYHYNPVPLKEIMRFIFCRLDRAQRDLVRGVVAAHGVYQNSHVASSCPVI